MKLERADDATKPENDKEYCLSVCLTDFDETRPRVQIFCLQRTFCLSIPIDMQCRFQLQVRIFFFDNTRLQTSFRSNSYCKLFLLFSHPQGHLRCLFVGKGLA